MSRSPKYLFRKSLTVLLALFSVFILDSMCLLFAQEITPTENEDDNTTTETQARDFSFSSDKTIVIFAEGREKTTLTGNASVISGSTELRADYIEVYGEEFRFVDCMGEVEVLDNEQGYRLKTDSLFFDRELEIVRGRGSNVMEDFNNEIVIKGEFLEHRNLEDRSEIQSGTRILGEDIIATAEFVRYQRDTEVLEFSGLPLVQWKEDEYQAARIVVDMRNDTVELQGEVYGEINIDDESGQSEENSAPIEDTPTEDTPTEDTPTEDTPTEDTPTEDVPTPDPDETTSSPASDVNSIPTNDASISEDEDSVVLPIEDTPTSEDEIPDTTPTDTQTPLTPDGEQ